MSALAEPRPRPKIFRRIYRKSPCLRIARIAPQIVGISMISRVDVSGRMCRGFRGFSRLHQRNIPSRLGKLKIVAAAIRP